MPAPVTPLDVYVVHQGLQARDMAWRVAEMLRDGGIRVLLHCGGGSFKAQMKKADASAAVCAIIIGDDEAAANEVMLKPLRDGSEQQRAGLENLQQKIRELIK